MPQLRESSQFSFFAKMQIIYQLSGQSLKNPKKWYLILVTYYLRLVTLVIISLQLINKGHRLQKDKLRLIIKLLYQLYYSRKSLQRTIYAYLAQYQHSLSQQQCRLQLEELLYLPLTSIVCYPLYYSITSHQDKVVVVLYTSYSNKKLNASSHRNQNCRVVKA